MNKITRLALNVVLLCAIALLNPLNAADPEKAKLSLTVTGLGTVVSDPPGIACPGTCEASFPAFGDVKLRARADKGQSFLGWAGACRSPTTGCRLYMDGEKIVQAAFSAAL